MYNKHESWTPDEYLHEQMKARAARKAATPALTEEELDEAECLTITARLPSPWKCPMTALMQSMKLTNK